MHLAIHSARSEAGLRITAKVTAIASMFLAMGAAMAGVFSYFG